MIDGLRFIAGMAVLTVLLATLTGLLPTWIARMMG